MLGDTKTGLYIPHPNLENGIRVLSECFSFNHPENDALLL